MAGEKNLNKILNTISPTLLSTEFVFCTFDEARYGDNSDLKPIAAVSEEEGLTLVIPRLIADKHELSYEFVFRCITLKVHSSLDAVGLTAAVATKLAEHGISANMLAGYFHDHIFVQGELANEAIAAIQELTVR